MGKFIPVEPEKWAEMVKALALVKEMDKTINASQAECRSLKEKSECQAECLEAFEKKLREAEAKIERLRKAGDYLYASFTVHSRHPNCDARDEWLRAKKGLPSLQEQWKIARRNAAKEGKQS